MPRHTVEEIIAALTMANSRRAYNAAKVAAESLCTDDQFRVIDAAIAARRRIEAM